jgi:hypothetical protein
MKMKLVIVGNKDGRHKVNWMNYFVLLFIASLITGLGTGIVYFILAHRWNPSSVLYGALIGAGTISVGLINGLRTPIERLSVLE